jgi:hypothetical protein
VAYSREGFSGMNGRTDDAEYFYQSDFQTVLSFAQSVGLGDVVSYDGDQWTANQWNYDEVPGGASGAWNSDGAC